MALPSVRALPLALAACALAAALAGSSSAAAPKTVSPTVKSVTPLKLRVGERLTVKGTGFLPGRRKNTVVFKRDGQRAIFVKADRATRTELVVVVPDKVSGFLVKQDGAAQPTRFRIRVLSRRFAKRFTPLSRSPQIGPAAADPAKSKPAPPPDCDADGTPDGVDLDDDNDLLADTAEGGYGTDRCKPDTDGDGLRDVWEVESALDLNLRANFFPGKAPYPNPLFAGDADQDFDQDGLKARQEHDLWQRSGAGVPMAYSDGDQDTTTGPTPRTSAAPETTHLDIDADGYLTDDEKDFDGDRLGNWDEAHGRMLGVWWEKRYDTEKPFFGVADAALLDVAAIAAIPGRAPMYADPDVDGDGLVDGLDDQDHDGFTNEQELVRDVPAVDTDSDGTPDRALAMNVYNPCLPDAASRTCSRHPPFGEPWAPFDESLGTPWVDGERRLFLAP